MLVSIVTKLLTRLLEFRIPAEARAFCLSLQMQNDLVATQPAIQCIPGAFLGN
jgi:hypothetical protein